MTNKRIVTWSVAIIVFLLAAIHILWTTKFKIEDANAQCIDYKLASAASGAVPCGSGWTNASQASTGQRQIAWCVRTF